MGLVLSLIVCRSLQAKTKMLSLRKDLKISACFKEEKTDFYATLCSAVLFLQGRSVLGEASPARSGGFAKNNRPCIITQIGLDLWLHPISCFIWEAWIWTSTVMQAEVFSCKVRMRFVPLVWASCRSAGILIRRWMAGVLLSEITRWHE